MNNNNAIPSEMLFHILQYVGMEDMFNMFLCCKSWNDLSAREFVWSFLYERELNKTITAAQKISNKRQQEKELRTATKLKQKHIAEHDFKRRGRKMATALKGYITSQILHRDEKLYYELQKMPAQRCCNVIFQLKKSIFTSGEYSILPTVLSKNRNMIPEKKCFELLPTFSHSRIH